MYNNNTDSFIFGEIIIPIQIHLFVAKCADFRPTSGRHIAGKVSTQASDVPDDIYIYIYIHTHIHTHTHVCMYVCIYIYIYTCTRFADLPQTRAVSEAGEGDWSVTASVAGARPRYIYIHTYVLCTYIYIYTYNTYMC